VCFRNLGHPCVSGIWVTRVFPEFGSPVCFRNLAGARAISIHINLTLPLENETLIPVAPVGYSTKEVITT